MSGSKRTWLWYARTRAPVSRSICPVNARVMMSSNVRRFRRTSALRPPFLSVSSTGVSTSSSTEKRFEG